VIPATSRPVEPGAARQRGPGPNELPRSLDRVRRRTRRTARRRIRPM